VVASINTMSDSFEARVSRVSKLQLKLIPADTKDFDRFSNLDGRIYRLAYRLPNRIMSEQSTVVKTFGS